MKKYVLDANALLDLVEAGAGCEKVTHLFQAAIQRQSLIAISVLNWGEVFYVLWHKRGEEAARRTTAELSRLPLEIVPVDLPQVLEAAELEVLHKIPYVDCIAAALALQYQATLVTSDRDFEKLGGHFPVLWISRR